MMGDGMDDFHGESEVKPVVDLYSLKCLFQDIGCKTNLNDLYQFVIMPFLLLRNRQTNHYLLLRRFMTC